jgi:hypothetical protein
MQQWEGRYICRLKTLINWMISVSLCAVVIRTVPQQLATWHRTASRSLDMRLRMGYPEAPGVPGMGP